MFQVFSAGLLCSSRVFTGVDRGKNPFGVLGGFPGPLPTHQGMEDRGTYRKSSTRIVFSLPTHDVSFCCYFGKCPIPIVFV